MGAAVTALRWDGRALSLLDQTLLPFEERWIELTGAADTAAAIARLAVRGAPNIGIAAAYGLAMEVARERGPGALERGAEVLIAARPTAVNLAYAVGRVRAAALAAGSGGAAAAARAEAQRIHAEEDAASEAVAQAGADLLAGARRPLTTCNTGALAAGGRGSALGVILALHDRLPVHVLVCETRPLLQGARLTTWELARAGVPHALIADGAAAGLLRAGAADAVVVGCDRVAANGDVANKVGTYALALAARAAGVPFVVAGPLSSVDPACADGDAIEIEERAAEEVLTFAGSPIAPAGTAARNPAFDITPAELITAFVCERGAVPPHDVGRICRHMRGVSGPERSAGGRAPAQVLDDPA